MNNQEEQSVGQSNLNKWDRKSLNKADVPKEILSVFYDSKDDVLFGTATIKGLITYQYLDGKFSTDGKPIFMFSSILYNGEGLKKCPNPELIREFKWIKEFFGVC